MTGLKTNFCLAAGIMLILAITAPTSADMVTPTSTKVFFEKDGLPYNGTVSFTVNCYGYMVDSTDPNYKNYWRGNYQRRKQGTYDQTEVFSYSATVDHYGGEIFEPFYLNYRVIDYCTLSGEADGQKFVIENTGDSPVPDCKIKERIVNYQSINLESDVCYISNNQSDKCRADERELKSEAYDQCEKYLEEFDKNKLYPEDTKTFDRSGKTIVITEENEKCTEKAGSIDLNCTVFDDEVSCKDYCDPEGQPVERDCSLYFTIPTDDSKNIIEIPEKEKDSSTVFINYTGTEKSESIFTIILKFLGLA